MKGLMYREQQLHKEREFLTYIQSRDFPADCILLPQEEAFDTNGNLGEIDLADKLLSFLQKRELEAKDVLWIVTSNAEYELARKLSIPTLCYGKDIAYPNAWMVVWGLEEVDYLFLERAYCRERNLPWMILETERCYVRELSLSDLPSLFALYAKPGVTDYIEGLFAPEEEKNYEKQYIENIYRYYGYGMWLVFEKKSNRLIGRAGVEPREEQGELINELGYLIDPDFWHQGYAYEVCMAILEYARKELELDRIYSLIDPGNTASIAFAQKLGFRFEKTVLTSQNPMNRYILY